MNPDRELETLVQLIGELRGAPYAPAVFATSFSAEDMVLTDLIAKHAPWIGVFTIDTGRLPEETYRLMQETRERYPIPIRTFLPGTRQLESFVQRFGPNGFYASPALRATCCEVRKIEPLRRALAGQGSWITGLRREQSPTRRDLPVREWDNRHGLHKMNPLAGWSQEQVWDYIHRFRVPYNALHDQGYPSIGCAPCTRAVQPGEDMRKGRWWWEPEEVAKECGLHRGPGQDSH